MRRFLPFAVAGVLVLASPCLRAQNLVTNPGFDQNLAGWVGPNLYDIQRSPTDANGSTSSGSLRATIPGGSPLGAVIREQCVPVTPNFAYDFSVKARVQELGVEVGGLRTFASADCSGSLLFGDSLLTHFSNGQPNVFVTTHRVFDMSANAHSAKVQLVATTLTNNASQTVYLDDVFFGVAAPPACFPDSETLCIDGNPGDDRFLVRARFATTQSGGKQGNAKAIGLSNLGVNRGGLFWFFSPDNPELLVKILDGCASTHFKWVFISAGTNVGVNLTIADTDTGAVVLFHNPDLGPFPAIQNIFGIPCS